MAEKQIQLTGEAQKRLDSAIDAYRTSLLESLEEGKFVPGERVIEITASDVDQAVDEFRYGSNRSLGIRVLYSQVALVAGAACLFFGVFYSQLLDAVGNPPQLIAFIAGLYLTFAGLVLYRLTILRSRETKSSTNQSIGDRLSRLERLLEGASHDESRHLKKRSTGAADDAGS